MRPLLVLLGVLPLILASEWSDKYGEIAELEFSGPLTFEHLPHAKCLEDVASLGPDNDFDIALLGLPFDTAVTYRPGARFGPYGIRTASRRQHYEAGYTLKWAFNPYEQGWKVLDCGDVPVSPFDNALAVDQMRVAYSTLLARTPAAAANKTLSSSQLATKLASLANDGKLHPRIVSFGGDHTIVLPILRSLHAIYGPITVIHFDSHLDTWPSYEGSITPQSQITHGTFFYIASEENLIANNSVHAGIRCKLGGVGDLIHDEIVGFKIITTDDIDTLGADEIIKRIRETVGDDPVYLSLDIDVIDPGMAPATGTPEAGGWTTRELRQIIHGLAGLNFVGADIVEVSPAYDHSEVTGIAAADIAHDFVSMFIVSPGDGSEILRDFDDVTGRKPGHEEL